ncbi:MAG TPA: hypothetical protein VLG47_08310 [Candidatus Saccharimonadales bacterium]|nr:hypothetical protein [Candidatus Saccharimonadales bacterium]
MSEQINTSINPNPIPQELQAYLPDAHAAEVAAFEAELPAIGDKIIRAANGYETAVSDIGNTAAHEAETENELRGLHFEAELEDLEQLKRDYAETVPKIVDREIAAVEAYPREVLHAKEDLRPGEDPAEGDGVAAEVAEYLRAPKLNEDLIKRAEQRKQRGLDDMQDIIDAAAGVDESYHDRSTGNTTADFHDTIDTSSNDWFSSDTLPPRPALSQLAEVQRQANEVSTSKDPAIDTARLRRNFENAAIVNNWSAEAAADMWQKMARRYPLMAETGQDSSPELIRDENGHVTGVDFANDHQNPYKQSGTDGQSENQ